MLGQVLELALQVGGLLLAGVVVAVAARGGMRPALAGAVAASALALLAAVTLAQSRESVDEVNRIADTRATEGYAGRTECAAERGIDVNFLNWLRERMPKGSRYQLVMTETFLARTADLCLELAVLPAVRVRELGRAHYVVFYEDVPQAVLDEAAARTRRLELYDPANADLALLHLEPPEVD